MRRLVPLMVTFVVLLLLVAWREAGRSSTKSLSEEASLRPLAAEPFQADDVAKVEVTAPGGDKPAYTLEREDKTWRVVGPFRAPATGLEVTKLLDLLAKSQGEFRTDDRAALEQFDLTPAREVGVKVIGKDGKTLAHVGVGASSMTHGAFVRNLAADDSNALAVAEDIRGALGLSRTFGKHEPAKPEPGHFHEKEFPQAKIAKAKEAEFVAPGRSAAFERVNKDEKDTIGEWKLTRGGPDAPFKKEAVETAMNSLSGQFHPTALVDPAKRSELGLDAAPYRTSFTGEDGVAHAVVGASDAAGEHYYVRLDAKQDPDVLYEASEYEFHHLFPTGAALFDLPKIDAGKDGPTHVVVEQKGRPTIELTRKGTKPSEDWTLVAPKWPLDPKQSALRNLGSSLPSIRITDYVDEKDIADAEITVRFGGVGAADTDLQTVRIGAKPATGKDRRMTLSAKPGHVYLVADNSIERLAPEPLSLFETKILHDWKKDDVTAIRTGEWSLVKDGDAWSIQEGEKKSPADKTAVTAWLDRLLGATASGTLAEMDLKAIPVKLERQDGTPIEIGVTKTKDGKPAVVLAGGFAVTVEGADDLVRDRAAFEPKAAKDEKPAPPVDSKPADEKKPDDGK